MKIVKSLDSQVINTLIELVNKIDYKRNELKMMAEKYGLSHELTIEKSQELDSILNEYKTYILYLKKIYTIEEIKGVVMPIAKKYHITEVYLYGSYARGSAKYNDDIDFAIKHKGETLINEFFNCISELEEAFEKHVDLMFLENVYKPKTSFDYKRNFFAEKFDREKIRIL